MLCLLFLHRECCRFFGDDGLTPRVFFTKVAPFGLLWILTNYLYLQALRKINTTDASALFCCNKAFVFLLSWIVLRDRFMGVRVSPSVHTRQTRMTLKQKQKHNKHNRLINYRKKCDTEASAIVTDDSLTHTELWLQNLKFNDRP